MDNFLCFIPNLLYYKLLLILYYYMKQVIININIKIILYKL